MSDGCTRMNIYHHDNLHFSSPAPGVGDVPPRAATRVAQRGERGGEGFASSCSQHRGVYPWAGLRPDLGAVPLLHASRGGGTSMSEQER
jgi:hypothetical protein